jgi:hypothetical protein
MRFQNYDIAKEFLRKGDKITRTDSFDLAKLASLLLNDEQHEKLGRDLIIRMKDAISKNRVCESTYPMWNEMLVAAGLFPYVDHEQLHNGSLIRYEYHKSDHLKNVFFHEGQLEVSMALMDGKPVILSAPTSYGKSLLIEEIVASNKYKNIVIIQPTLALLDETRKKLSKYKDLYKIVVSTSQDPSDHIGNVFLFTGERVVEYDRFPKIDFFVIDEFYKLSMERDDDRAIVLNQALYKLLKYTNKFYMLGPSIKDIPAAVKEKLGAVWQRTDFATVAVDDRMVGADGKKKIKEQRKEELFTLLNQLNEPTLIYVASPASCTMLALDFIKYYSIHAVVASDQQPKEISNMCEWIGEHIHKNWGLIDALQNDIGFHHGALPRHLGSSIVDAFNHGHIKYLFCTATLIEGVNTSAKNVVLFDKKKGNKPIDFFDYKNIAGRSGRMKQHFIGNVIRFEKEPPQLEFEVDIPIITQDNAPLEILLGMDKEDVKPALRNRLDTFSQLPDELQQIIKKHSTVNIEGQLAIIKELEFDIRGYHQLLNWSSAYPTYNQLNAVIAIAWKHLAKDEDRKMRVANIGSLSDRWLCSFALGYNMFGSLGALVGDLIRQDFWITKIPDNTERINAAAFSALHISRTYFDYKLPKWISIVNGLQEYVFTKVGLKPGNYAPIASRLENGFLDAGLAALREYDIPLTAIRKLSAVLRDYQTPEQNIQNINQLNEAQLKRMGLLNYEISKIRQAF